MKNHVIVRGSSGRPSATADEGQEQRHKQNPHGFCERAVERWESDGGSAGIPTPKSRRLNRGNQGEAFAPEARS